ncbi:hypothetical protein LCGC14_0501020 [marine sediment metagenome]|uniref:Uncharacterized protein n=1 Tax=marine sediment metagenome TaxID=412755 RepID=A0A0F9SMB8_9ZZZZ|nr:hypothetical protein [Pricia sp.]
MENIKYTTDGKKVVVIGNLNSQEKIVQEIFIIGGQEIPSGENFVVKTLHDSPAISWKETRTKEIKKQYEEKQKECFNAIKVLEDNYKKVKDVLSSKTAYLREVINKVALESFDLLVDFLNGDIKYMVSDSYDPELIEYKDFRCDYDKNKLKLITLFGSDDGTLNWGINSYSDGSGSNKMYYAFNNREDALAKLEEVILAKGRITENIIKTAKKHNIELDAKKVKEFKDKMVKTRLKNIESSKKEIEKFESAINDIKNL